ncbi:MAG: galactose-1-epimerase, partial [Bacteroidales bacterium]|nr:galactose-1-epimerase [Bacteroidales bacterium]
MTVTRKIWARTPDGTPIYRYTITNASGASVVLSNYGAAIVAVNVPDKAGRLGDVVLGYGKAEHYFHDGPCFGKCPGRFANRIAKGRFTLDGVTYELPVNNDPNHLHGGP